MKKEPRTVLGIDLGTTNMGYSVIRESSSLSILEQGIVPTTKGMDLSFRLKEIHTYLTDVIEKYKPDCMAFEDVFFVKNKKTALDVASVRGVVLLVGEQAHIKIVKYTPLQVKQAVTGWGRADKQQVQKMVQHILQLDEIPKPDDVADAMAVALCCIHST